MPSGTGTPTQAARDRVFVRVTYAKTLGAAQAHVRYIAYRSRETELDERGGFDREHDHAQVDQFTARLADPLTRHTQVAKVHKIIVSLRQDQWERAGLSSWKPLVREALTNFEQSAGKRLEWLAAEHMTRGHPHCHVTVKSVYTDPEGRRHRLRLNGRDIRQFKGEFQRIYEREGPLRGLDQALHKEQQVLERPRMGKMAGELLRQIARAVRQQQRRHELEHELIRERERRR